MSQQERPALWCYQEEVEKTGDPELCENIIEYWPIADGVHGECYFRLALKKKDCSLCRRIHKEVSTPLRRMLVAYRGTVEVLLREAGAADNSTHLACLLVAIVEGLALQWMIDPDVLEKDHARQIVKKAVQHQLNH